MLVVISVLFMSRNVAVGFMFVHYPFNHCTTPDSSVKTNVLSCPQVSNLFICNEEIWGPGRPGDKAPTITTMNVSYKYHESFQQQV